MSKKYKQIRKSSRKETDSVNTKYSWKFWCMVIVEITIIVTIILWFGLSVKALVQNIQMLYFENKAEGTVTVAEYEGAKTIHNTSDSGSSTEYEHVRYVIEFDHEESGYSQYEYHADNIISSRKYEGQRFIVLFNEIDNPTLIREEAVAEDNFFLISFLVFCTIAVIFRRDIFLWVSKVGEKLDDYI